ncbi:hypothetical protein MMC09_001684 [Bachmanniomyces sp. S44760]|nr:hypothetical protein [Bachmanniomyces sp. S44760]
MQCRSPSIYAPPVQTATNLLDRNVIDVFTSLPQPALSGKVTQFDSCVILLTRKETSPELNGTSHKDTNGLPTVTIKKGRYGPVVSKLGKDLSGWKAVKEAMG